MRQPTTTYPLPPVYLCWLLALLLGVLAQPSAFGASGPEIAAAIRQQAGQLHVHGKTASGNGPVRHRELLADLYAKEGFAPLWTRPVQVERMLAAIANSEREGLRPDDYHAQALRALGRRLDQRPEALAAGERDLLLTDALLSLSQDKLYGKVDPERIDNTWNLSTKRQEAAVRPLLVALKEDRLDRMLPRLSPSQPFYTDLTAALARYRAIVAQGGWPGVPDGPVLKPGMRDSRVEALRRRLLVTGDLTRPGPDPTLFDAELVAAVKAFQQRHYLEPDGIVGKTMLAALNVPVAERIDQIRINLERSRWVLRDLPDSFLIVDIAGFDLHYRNQGKSVWTSRVVVGKPFHQTPVFRSEISQVVLNPTWTVPAAIASKEMLPQILKDPGYLARQNLRLLAADGREVPAARANLRQYAGKSLPYTLRQDAGPDNALGRIKFNFDNPYSVYLHDTPSKSLFDKTSRAFSHGCIRVQNPLELGRMLLRNDTGNNAAADFDRLLATGETRAIALKRPVPVILLYWTALARDGQVWFKPDLYGRDRPVLAALNAPSGTARPLRKSL